MWRRTGLALLLATASPSSVWGSVFDTLNAIRSQGCGTHRGVNSRLTLDATLSAAAQRMRQGIPLSEALAQTHTHAPRSSSIAITRAADDDAIARVLKQHYCAEVSNSAFQRVGIAQVGQDSWIILATAFDPPSPGAAPVVRGQVLELINQARSRARNCGTKAFSAAKPLALNARLNHAALAHAQDMAAQGQMGHRGSDGSTPAERVTRAGYSWLSVGENVAAGGITAEETVAGWIASPHHCANLMSEAFTQTGIAYAVNPASADGIYWVQAFASPR